MSDKPEDAPSRRGFVPVCAIGASAGGVAVLQSLFRLLPDDLGLAYVVVVHLSPDHPSAMHEILADCTAMPVYQVNDGPRIEANRVYVIPPGRELVIDGDDVRSRPFTDPRGRRAPIDMFFRSIAAGRGDGIAVVLTGGGSDGAVGVRAVKEAGGLVMVQDPAEAGVASMPQNAIATGVADVVGPVAVLAERIAEAARAKEKVRGIDEEEAAGDLRRIVSFLRARTGHDFSGYKRATVLRRVKRRMQICQADSLADYARHLRVAPEEAKALFADLLISVTLFFRDPAAFRTLAQTVVGPLLEAAVGPEGDGEVRAWVVGCATGEEAYGLAILFLEEAERRNIHVPVQIFATDLDEGALATAREGRYPRSIEADVSPDRLKRFFVDEESHYRIARRVRDMVLFAVHSVVREPPFMRLDLVTCRNVLIYLERSLQQQVCAIFHYGLKPGGALFLGPAESADMVQDQFRPVDREARLYRARAMESGPVPRLSAPSTAGLSRPFPVLQDRAAPPRFEPGEAAGMSHTAALEASAPPSALVDADHAVLNLSPTAGRFILLSGGPLSGRLPSIVHPELRLDLRMALDRAFDAGQPTATRAVDLRLDGAMRRVSVHVAPVPVGEGAAPRAIVFFLDDGPSLHPEAPDAPPASDEFRQLHAELKAAQEAALAGRIGYEAALQELRASNEELQSLNEEYRSTAEELETSKEELQSINEELHAVNAEMKVKLSVISAAHDDLQNLTASSEIGTLFLDTELRIRMFTPPVAELINVTAADVGRPITSFTHRLAYDGLERDARRVMADFEPVEKEIRAEGGRWFALRLRPYRTADKRVEGAVVTFDDITARKRSETVLRDSEERQAFLVRLGDALRQAGDADEVRAAAARVLIRQLGARRAQWFDAGLAGGVAEALNGFAEDGALHAGPLRLDDFGPSLEGDCRAGQSFVLADAAADPRIGAEEARRFEATGGRASVWVPAVEAGRPASLLRVDGDAPRDWSGAEVALIEETAERVRVAVERSRAEEALRESETRFRAFVTVSSDAIFRMSPDWSEMREMEGRRFLRDTEGPSRTWLDRYVVPEDQPTIRAAAERGIRDRSMVELKHRVIRADGSLGWASSRAVPILGERGEIREWLGTARDVTAARQAEAARRESDTLRRVAVEGSGMGTWRWDLRERQVWGDPRFLVLWGFPPSAAAHPLSAFTDRMSPESAAEMGDMVARAIAAGEEFDGQLEVVGGPTAGHWVRWRGRADADDPAILSGITFDVTEQRRAERARRESEARLRALVDGAPQVVWRSTGSGAWTWSSPQWTAYTGLSEEESRGDGWLAALHPDDRAPARAAWMAAEERGSLDMEVRVREAASGDYRWFQSRALPVRDPAGGVIEWLGTSADVQDLKALQESQAVMVAELQHRTRNLLAVVRGVVDDTMDETGPTEAFRAAFADRLAALSRVQALLSRAEAEPITIGALVAMELDALGAGATRDRVSVEGPEVFLKPSTVQTLALAIHELATNARKYGALSHGGGRLAVTWRERSEDGAPRLALDWVETGLEQLAGRPALDRTGGGYGRELIERALPHATDARTSYALTASGVRCTIDIAVRPAPGRSEA